MKKDYQKLRQEAQRLYVQGAHDEDGEHYYPTFSKLAQLIGVRRETLGKWAAQDGWVEEREVYQIQAVEAANKGALEAIEKESSEAMRRILQLARDSESYIEDFLSQYSDAKELAKAGNGEMPTPNMKHAADLSRALKDLAEAIQKASGDADTLQVSGPVDIVSLIAASTGDEEMPELETDCDA